MELWSMSPKTEFRGESAPWSKNQINICWLRPQFHVFWLYVQYQFSNIFNHICFENPNKSNSRWCFWISFSWQNWSIDTLKFKVKKHKIVVWINKCWIDLVLVGTRQSSVPCWACTYTGAWTPIHIKSFAIGILHAGDTF